MFYQKELDFLTKILSNLNVNIFTLTEGETMKENNNFTLFDNRKFFTENLSLIKENRIYKYTDNFSLSYRFFILPKTERKKVLFIGPFLNEPISDGQMLKIEEENQISIHQHKFLLEYYSSLPVIIDNSPILTMINTFYETIFGTNVIITNDFAVENSSIETPFSKTLKNANPEEELIKKETIERRYSFENALIRAVSLGQTHVVSQFTTAFKKEFFENRTADPLQNSRNYCIIMNTLLRKGAEQGGVHPVYLNETSSLYAHKIEKLSLSREVPELMKEMFYTYCNLVRKHNIRKYSPIVQKTILLIDADLSSDLTTKTLASHQDVSLGYLSSIFKKETGKTLSQYVYLRRMDYAEYLLKTTNLQISTIAMHCGVMDMQYFSKQFKKYKGITPSHYRKKNK